MGPYDSSTAQGQSYVLLRDSQQFGLQGQHDQPTGEDVVIEFNMRRWLNLHCFSQYRVHSQTSPAPLTIMIPSPRQGSPPVSPLPLRRQPQQLHDGGSRSHRLSTCPEELPQYGGL